MDGRALHIKEGLLMARAKSHTQHTYMRNWYHSYGQVKQKSPVNLILKRKLLALGTRHAGDMHEQASIYTEPAHSSLRQNTLQFQ